MISGRIDLLTYLNSYNISGNKFFKQHLYKLSNTLRLNFRYVKIIRFLHPRYNPRILRDTLKNVQKQVRLFW